jgi:hypothetical protein
MIVAVIEDLQIDGIIATNTTISRDKSAHRCKPVTAAGEGGLSGKPLRNRSTQMIAELYELTGGRIPLIGVGGIFTAEDAWEKICAGRKPRAVVHRIYLSGTNIANDINEGLEKILAREKLREPRGRRRSAAPRSYLCNLKGDQLTAKDKLIVALDVDTPAKALDLVKQLHSVAGMFKIGSTLFTSAGPQIVRDIIALDAKVFLDLKFHDIPHQVAGAARSAAELGVSLFTIHASGGSEMMRRAVDLLTRSRPKVVCAQRSSPSAFSPASTRQYSRKSASVRVRVNLCCVW